jgi:hypothetical protein
MSIFTKPISQLVTADLQELLDERAVENVRLEFKREVPNKDESLKKLSSFANTFGGFMVIGASARSTDGRIESLPGVDAEAGYKQKIIQWCFDGATPSLTAEVSDPIPTPAGDGKVCYVVNTPESDLAPHFLNGRKGVWVRTDEFSARFEARLADEIEIRQLLDRRRLIRDRRAAILERARRRFSTYVQTRTTPTSGRRDSLLEFSMVPRFPSRPVTDPASLPRTIQQNYVPWRGVTFPNPSSGVISQHESAIVLEAARGKSMFEANVWGMLYYCRNITAIPDPSEGIHLYAFVGFILLFIRHADKMLAGFGYSGPLHIETRLISILKVPWLVADPFGTGLSLYPREGSELDDEVAFSTTSTREALREKPDGVAIDILRQVFFSVNAPDLIDTPQKLEALIRSGYAFNSWTVPDKLRI